MPSLAKSLAQQTGVSGISDVPGLQTALDGKADRAWTVRTVTGTTDTTLAADSGNPVLCTNAGAVAISVPSGLPLGVYPYFFMGGAATQGTFTGTGGLTVTPAPGFALKSRIGASGAAVYLSVLSSAVAVLSGDLAFV